MIGLHGAMLCDLTESDLTDSDSTESYDADVNTNTNKDKNENGNNDNNDGDGDGDGNIKNDSILGKLLTSQSSDEIIQHATETAVVLIAGNSNPFLILSSQFRYYHTIFLFIVYSYAGDKIVQ